MRMHRVPVGRLKIGGLNKQTGVFLRGSFKGILKGCYKGSMIGLYIRAFVVIIWLWGYILL